MTPQTESGLEGLKALLGEEGLWTDPMRLQDFLVDGHTPKGVAFPSDIQELAEVVHYANRQGLGVLPWGNGTKMSLGRAPEPLDLVLCTCRMNHLLEVDTANLTMTVEAGVRLRDIQARLATEEDRCYLPLSGTEGGKADPVCSERSHHGCFLPLDPPFANRATIGGIVAANASGPRRLLYGLPRDLILGMRFVSPEGKVIRSGGKTVKNVSGYDVTKLMIGSHGSLGIVAEVTFRLLPLPERMTTLLFPFPSLEGALMLAEEILDARLTPAAVELADTNALHRAGFKPQEAPPSGAVWALVALEGVKEAVARMERDMDSMAKKAGALGKMVLDEESHTRFWSGISELQGRLSRLFPGLLSLELRYPLSLLRKILQDLASMLGTSGLEHAFLAHAGSGTCLLHLLRGEEKHPEGTVLNLVQSLLELCVDAGGNLLIHQAPLRLKPHLPLWGRPGPDLCLMKRLKRKLDPGGTLSPGRFPPDQSPKAASAGGRITP